VTDTKADAAVMAAMAQCARSPAPDLEPLIETVTNVAELQPDVAMDAIERLVQAGKLRIFRPISGDMALRIRLTKKA